MQLSLGYHPSPLTCMHCGETGATLPVIVNLNYTFEYNGKVRQTKAYGYRHEGCNQNTPVQAAGMCDDTRSDAR